MKMKITVDNDDVDNIAASDWYTDKHYAEDNSDDVVVFFYLVVVADAVDRGVVCLFLLLLLFCPRNDNRDVSRLI